MSFLFKRHRMMLFSGILGSFSCGILIIGVAYFYGFKLAAVYCIIGLVAVILFFSLGMLTEIAIISVLSKLAMLIILLSYVLRLTAIWLVVQLCLETINDKTDRKWLAIGVFGPTIGWLVGMSICVATKRMLIFDSEYQGSARKR